MPSHSGSDYLNAFLFISSEDTWWKACFVWITRLLTISLLLRTYIVPWILTRLSSHIRIRSISFRSLRGLYIRQGSRRWKVERITYSWSHTEGMNRLSIRVDGLNVEVGRKGDKKPVARRHRRGLTLADFAPSPMARRLWSLVSSLYWILEPVFRPLFRHLVAASLRQIIRWLPKITQRLTFDLRSAVVSLKELPGTQLVADSVHFQISLAFSQLESGSEEASRHPRRHSPVGLYGMASWKRLLSDGFRRSWDRAWGKVQGTATLSLQLNDVKGITQLLESRQFVAFPGSTDIQASLSFNPRVGTIDAHSLVTSLQLGECQVAVDVLSAVWGAYKQSVSRDVEPSDATDSDLLSPSFSTLTLPSNPSSSLSPSSPPFFSQVSPTSPFLEAISASVRYRRRPRTIPSRFSNAHSKAPLSILLKSTISATAIKLVAHQDLELGIRERTYETVIHNTIFETQLSDPRHSLHRQWLGRDPATDYLQPDHYRLCLSIPNVTIDWFSSGSRLRLVTITSIKFNTLVTQWPAPWLVVPQFLSGDPNASFLAAELEVGSLHLTDRIERLREYMARAETLSTPHSPRVYPRKQTLSVPRLDIKFHIGPICARIISRLSLPIDAPHAIELRTDGFIAHVSSNYSTRRHLPVGGHANPFCLPVQMSVQASAVLMPTLIRVSSPDLDNASKWRGDTTASDPSFLNDPPLLSFEAIQLLCASTSYGDFDDSGNNTPTVDLASALLDVHCTTDTVCLELWHPGVVSTCSQLVTLFARHSKKPSSTAPKPLILPSGLVSAVTCSRLVVFVTSPELNKKDDLDLSRGCVLRTGLTIQYCNLDLIHTNHFPQILEQSQTRHKLFLPEEQAIKGLASAKATAVSRKNSAFLDVFLADLGVRSAVANPYVADDPLVAEGDDTNFRDQEYIKIRSAAIKLQFSGHDEHPLPAFNSCSIFVHLPDIRATILLAHVYSMLLATRTVTNLLPTRHHQPARQSTITYQFHAEIHIMQIVWPVPRQKICSHLQKMVVQSSSDGSLDVKWKTLNLSVQFLPSMRSAERWSMLGSLKDWNISILWAITPLSLIIEGGNTHIRIPHGFVLAEMINDLNITFKALRHLTRVVPAGRLVGIESPEAEAPKIVPALTLRLRCFCLEAEDDPFESKLAIIFKAGLGAAKYRQERERAFALKVAAIMGAPPSGPATADGPEVGGDYNFDAKHTVSIEEARRRLDQLHSVDWTFRHRSAREKRAFDEDAILRYVGGIPMAVTNRDPTGLISPEPSTLDPPLCRLILNGVSLSLSGPSFPLSFLPDFLREQGGLPVDSMYYLLLPMHVTLRLLSMQFLLRDYPLPLLLIPVHEEEQVPALTFSSDIVIAEEVGTDLSIDWIECSIVDHDFGIKHAAALTLSVPKTIMPVKSYANPNIEITTGNVTTLSWGVSYGPCTQDLMRIVDTLTSSPRDASPTLGFWDKMRLVFHWNVKAHFRGNVHLHMKGSRDPYEMTGAGAGFVLSWQGNTKLLIGYPNDGEELIQVISDSMTIAIPSQDTLQSLRQSVSMKAHRCLDYSSSFQKICAKLQSGVRFGVGFVLERSCGTECLVCSGPAFHRRCRFFDFLPHHEVKLERKVTVPEIKGPSDSYNTFRSDFVHLSISLTSSTRIHGSHADVDASSLHLTPKAFTHFWKWWGLFDSTLSLPVRQGTLYPRRIISPKFSRHLATIKYLISIPRLFVVHAYMDDSRETWVDGITPFVGIKAMIDDLQVDMHQRDQESIVPGRAPNTTKIIRRKPFYAAEVGLKGVDLRALVATFVEPLKQSVPVTCPPRRSNYRTREKLTIIDPSSQWLDSDDFVEIDWSSATEPVLHLLPVLSCPRFHYCKRYTPSQENQIERSKFGDERSHTCFLGKEPTANQVQISLATARIVELRTLLNTNEGQSSERMHEPSDSFNPSSNSSSSTIGKMISLLETYINHLRASDSSRQGTNFETDQNFYFPSDTVTSDEWTTFENVYQAHCPKIFLNSAIRDIMIQYYHCSRARRGFEYHMATRAIRFILDQAQAISAASKDVARKTKSISHPAQAAASAIRKILTGDNQKTSVEVSDNLPIQPEAIDPMSGWSDTVSLRKSHFCLLLKPQIVLRSEGTLDSICVLAAVQAKLQSFQIMDKSNVDDPISGKVINYGSLSGLQAFSPVSSSQSGDGCVPFEVLIDFRCESDEFDRLVPQTDATFHYDKFNRLRLRNNVTSVTRGDSNISSTMADNHLQNQTDLIKVNIPRFTVTAGDQHFQTISDIVTNLILFSDAAHKVRMDKLETLLFTYDFTDLVSAAAVVSDVQSRLRIAVDLEQQCLGKAEVEDKDKFELLKIRAHICSLAEELTLLFDAIKIAQDRSDDQNDQKSALLLHACSSEISWRMLDQGKELLAKLSVRNIDFYWLSRQDSSTVNSLMVGDLQAFDGSRHALWTEILCKYDEPANHPLLKKGLFLLAHWTVLAPVGGITIYEDFRLSLHPMRLQIDAKVGRRIMEYLWPARKNRHQRVDAQHSGTDEDTSAIPYRLSLDSPRALQSSQEQDDAPESGLNPPQLRKLGASRSFTDLRSTTSAGALAVQGLQRTRSSDALNGAPLADELHWGRHMKVSSDMGKALSPAHHTGDAAEMRTRSAQKSFVLVRISSLHILLSILKEESFECREARIRTRDLEYRNQTWSFEELVDQFIPSDMSWKGWVKMALHQPLVPVLPVARELISKTKWIMGPKGAHAGSHSVVPQSAKPGASSGLFNQENRSTTPPPKLRWRKPSRKQVDPPSTTYNLSPLTAEPESFDPDGESSQPHNRGRMFSLFNRASSHSRKSTTNSRSTSLDAESPRYSAESSA